MGGLRVISPLAIGSSPIGGALPESTYSAKFTKNLIFNIKNQ